MNLNRLPRLATASLILATLFAPVAHATTRVSNPASVTSAPPSYPDSVHVLNGCLLSSIRFLNRFLAEYPAERGETLVVTLRNANGSRQAHTIALISWQGEAWGRDEYYGVFSLGCAAESKPNLDRLSALAERKLAKHAQKMVSTGQAEARTTPPTSLSAEQNLRDVTTAVKLIPHAAKIFWVRSGNREIPMAFFRPDGKRIAVYDPVHGTATAECALSDDAQVVQLVATQLGYRAASVRAELPLPQPSLLASADLTAVNTR